MIEPDPILLVMGTFLLALAFTTAWPHLMWLAVLGVFVLYFAFDQRHIPPSAGA